MRTAAPEFSTSLIDYRARLTNLVGTRIPEEFLTSCTASTTSIAVLNLASGITMNIDRSQITRTTASRLVAPFTFNIGSKPTDTGRIAIDCATGYYLIRFDNGTLFEAQQGSETFSRELNQLLCP